VAFDFGPDRIDRSRSAGRRVPRETILPSQLFGRRLRIHGPVLQKQPVPER